jgi:hypothetical protein
MIAKNVPFGSKLEFKDKRNDVVRRNTVENTIGLGNTLCSNTLGNTLRL